MDTNKVYFNIWQDFDDKYKHTLEDIEVTDVRKYDASYRVHYPQTKSRWHEDGYNHTYDDANCILTRQHKEQYYVVSLEEAEELIASDSWLVVVYDFQIKKLKLQHTD